MDGHTHDNVPHLLANYVDYEQYCASFFSLKKVKTY